MFSDKNLHRGNKSQELLWAMREISGTDGYYAQYTLSIYFLLPKSVIDLFSRHCAKKCVCNRKKN